MKDTTIKFIDTNGETKYIVDYDTVSEDRYKSIQQMNQLHEWARKHNDKQTYFEKQGYKSLLVLTLAILFVAILNILKKQKTTEYTDIYDLIKNITDKDSFNSLILDLFPKSNQKNVKIVLKKLKLPINPNVSKIKNYFLDLSNYDVLFSAYGMTFFQKKDEYLLPYRIFIPELSENQFNKLNVEQKIVYNCIFTLHHDGFVREKSLKYLKDIEYDWVIPFKLNLLGDKVLNILIELNNQITEENKLKYQKFIKENHIFYNYLKSRVNSFWNEYHKDEYLCNSKCVIQCVKFDNKENSNLCKNHFTNDKNFILYHYPIKQQYPGFQIIEKLKIRNK